MIDIRIMMPLALALASCGANDPTGDARRLGLAFCRAMEAGEDISAEALMSPGLQAAIARARAADAAVRKTRPAAKSLLADGLRLRANDAAIDDCAPRVAAPTLVMATYRTASTAAWQDRLELVAGPSGRPVIGDIVYGSGDGSRFSQWLAGRSISQP